MTQPTKEEVEKKINELDEVLKESDNYDYCTHTLRALREAWSAYLALREEVKMLEDELEATEMDRGVMIAANGKKIQLIEELQADNEELRAQLLKCNRTLSSWVVRAPK